MSRFASTSISAPRLTLCEGSLRRTGRGGRATGAAGHDRVPPNVERHDGPVARVTPSAMPDALGGAWRAGLAERVGRGPLSAPETPRRGAERGPLTKAGRLAPMHGAESRTSAATSYWTTKRSAGRGAGRNVTHERTAQ